MAKKNRPEAPPANLAELLDRLGGVPLERVLINPPLGWAGDTELLAARKGSTGKLVELVEGVLVEKAVGTREALLGGILLHMLWVYLESDDLGQALPGNGLFRLLPGVVRAPNVSFVRWEKMPDRKLPDTPIAPLAPDFAVEIVSEGTTRGEIERKIREYFFAGTTLVWVIDPRKQTAAVYSSPDDLRRVGKAGSLDGGSVLPGFRVALKDLFARTRRRSA